MTTLHAKGFNTGPELNFHAEWILRINFIQSYCDVVQSFILYFGAINSKICLKQPLKKKTKIGFQDRLLLNAGKSIAECSMRAFYNTFDTSLSKTFALSIFEWLLKNGFTLLAVLCKTTNPNVCEIVMLVKESIIYKLPLLGEHAF